MLKKIVIFLALVLAFAGGWFTNDYFLKNTEEVAKVLPSADKIIDKPLEKYSIENLSSNTDYSGDLKINNEIEDEEEYTSYKFTLEFTPALDKEEKETSGLINIPKGDEKFPLVLMIRGWAPQQNYLYGTGTRPAGREFAKAGFITVSPDFLGYADSDENAADIFESRFQTYTTALATLNSLDQIEQWDKKNVFLWAHSNGGQITLTLLEITGVDYPTTLWAPVTKYFPYSILHYTDESEDKGKFIRSELARFEQIYDVDKFSLDEYLDRIDAPLQFHQGDADPAIPLSWTSETVNKLRALDKDVTYHIYPGADHNLRPDWDTVVERDIEFFLDHTK